MPEISYEEAASPSGNQSAGIIWGLAPLIQAEACSVYEVYPEWVLFSPFGSLDPLNPVRRNLWARLCPKSPPPPPNRTPGIPFTGGQCPQDYHVLAYFSAPPPYVGVKSEFLRVTGPLGVRQVACTPPVGSCPSGTGPGCFDVELTTAGGNFPIANGSGCLSGAWSFDSFEVDPLDGKTDLCGNPPVLLVPPPPIPPPTQQPVPLTIVDGQGESQTFNLTWNYNPIVAPDPTPLPPDHDFSRDPNFNVSFTINNSFTVSLNHYGFNFNFGDSAASNAAQAAADTGAATSAATSASGAATSAATQAAAAAAGITAVGGLVQTAVNNAVPAKPQVLTPQPPNAPPKTGVPTLYGLQVTLTAIPANANPQKGVTGPDIYQGGWIEFSKGTYAFPRQPINYVDSVFIAPVGADGYAITYKEGYSGFATEIQNTP